MSDEVIFLDDYCLGNATDLGAAMTIAFGVQLTWVLQLQLAWDMI